MISHDLATIVLSFSIIGLTIACISCIVGCLALCKIIGLEKSTHQVQFVPIDEEINKANEEFRATPSSVLAEEQKLYNQQLEDEMPEFALSEEDKKTFSF
jgi:hypothetical protein